MTILLLLLLLHRAALLPQDETLGFCRDPALISATRGSERLADPRAAGTTELYLVRGEPQRLLASALQNRTRGKGAVTTGNNKRDSPVTPLTGTVYEVQFFTGWAH